MLDKIKNLFKKEEIKPVIAGQETKIVHEFPKIKRLPWSGGVSLFADVSDFIERDLVITEKVKGIDIRFSTDAFATKDNLLEKNKELEILWTSIKKDIPNYWQLFGTYIEKEYNSFPGTFVLHSIRLNPENDWVSWSDIKTVAKSFNLPYSTKFWGGSVNSEKELQELTMRLMRANNYTDLVVRDRHHFLNINNSVTKLEA